MLKHIIRNKILSIKCFNYQNHKGWGAGACTGVGVHVCVLKCICKTEDNFDYKASRTVHLVLETGYPTVSQLTNLGYNVRQRVPGIARTHDNIHLFFLTGSLF